MGFPQQPNPNETPIDYSRRLRTLVNGLASPQFVSSNPNRSDGQFQFHSQAFEFGATELAGLKMFLAEPAALPASPAELAAGKIGNCIACHAAPNFTDFKLHNTGTTQTEYDSFPSHGAGAFFALPIPTLATRTANDLPATEQHPGASERFRSIPSDGTTLTDLGVWNVFANPDMPDCSEQRSAPFCAMTNSLVRCPMPRSWIAPSPDSKLRAYAISVIPRHTCTTASSILWTTSSRFIAIAPHLPVEERCAMEPQSSGASR